MLVLYKAQLRALAARDADPSPERAAQQKALAEKIGTKNYKGISGSSAFTKIDGEERCSKPFFNRYRPNLTRKPIAALHEMQGTQPKL